MRGYLEKGGLEWGAVDMREKLTKAQKKYIEEILFHKDETEERVQQLKEDMIYSRPHRELVPGRGYISDPTARVALKMSVERTLLRAQFELEAVATALNKLGKEHNQLFELKYQGKERNWRLIAEEIGFSVQHCYRLRDQLLAQVGRELAIIE